jgi:hypothetical protein
MTFLLFLVSPLVRGQNKAGPPPKAEPAPVHLPVTRVVLFNAGVGYFHREGTVEGDAKFELRFPESDVNDLIKSLVLADKDGGKVRAVTYDNRTPVEFTLKSFAVDLTENPTVGQLLHQVRGEKVEVTDKAGAVLVGQIVSVERPTVVAGTGTPDTGEQLNLLTEDGVQSVSLRESKKIKFVRPEMQAEFRKALEVLAAARGDGKKAVAVAFTGNGRRRVAVGYVTEAPMWKPTYRLTVDEKGAARIQGWAAVENTTDEDWVNVRVGLVAGRPVSFQMDLYDPLFVPRPTVEPDLFASLRPPMYQGGLNPGNAVVAQNQAQNLGNQVGGFNAAGGIGGIGGIQGGGFNIGGFQGGIGGFNIGGGFQGQIGLQGQYGNLAAQYGLQGGLANPYLPRVPRPDVRQLYGSRLTYADYINRVRNPGAAPAAPGQAAQAPIKDPFDPKGGVLAAAEGGSLGDSFEYKIADPISLPRQKSALLPIVNEAVEGGRVSIFNAKTLAKHPLLGVKLINKTKLHLAQGPVTVYEGDTFAGDARLPDLKPGETRLISYAIDLGTEVVGPQPKAETTLVAVKVGGGRLETASRDKTTTRYLVRNRNGQDRSMVIEHPIHRDWKLTAPERPADRTRDYYRFEVAAKAGELTTFEVVEEHDGYEGNALGTVSDDTLVYYSKQDVTKPAVRAVLTKLLEMRRQKAELAKQLAEEQAALKEIGDDQDRIRKNLERVPRDAEAYKRYLKKFDDQETEIEKRQARVKELKAEAAKQEKALQAFVEEAKAE